MAQKRLSEAAKKRLRAGRLLQAGKSCAEVALAVGVARQTVHTWTHLLHRGGIDALRAVPERGRPPRLDSAQLERVRWAIQQSATKCGFSTKSWTLKRVGTFIERVHGVRYGPTQIWRILGNLGFSLQEPDNRTIEHEEDAARVRKL